MGRMGWAVAAIIGIVLIVGAYLVVTMLLQEPAPPPVGSLDRPARGEVRADYLSDGTPVWVVGLGGEAVGVVSALSTHRPANVGILLWWCAKSEAFEDAAYGSTFDPRGFKIGGPAPTGLPVYDATVVGSGVQVGDLGPAPPPDSGHSGPPASERGQCLMPDDAAAILVHTFEGWTVHDSPTEAVASAPDGWILLAGEVSVDGNDAMLCAIGDCTDAVLVADVDPSRANSQFSPLTGDRFIARVRDGALVDLTRVLPSGD
jgi:hypothetical protein